MKTGKNDTPPACHPGSFLGTGEAVKASAAYILGGEVTTSAFAPNGFNPR
jgi:hypothetical protein